MKTFIEEFKETSQIYVHSLTITWCVFTAWPYSVKIKPGKCAWCFFDSILVVIIKANSCRFQFSGRISLHPSKIGFSAVWWSSKPIRTSFPFHQYHSLSQPPSVCVCVCVHVVPVTSLSSGSATGSFCSLFNQMNVGVWEWSLPSCTSSMITPSSSIQVARAAHSASSQKM